MIPPSIAKKSVKVVQFLEQDGRLPAAYFASSTFCDEGFEEYEIFFLSENHFLFIISSNFSHNQTLLIFA